MFNIKQLYCHISMLDGLSNSHLRLNDDYCWTGACHAGAPMPIRFSAARLYRLSWLGVQPFAASHSWALGFGNKRC